MYFVDHLHQHGIGVILDWVPSHFPTDAHGLGLLRRHAPLRARRPAPGRASRLGQRRSSTTAATRCAPSCSSSALFWLDKYHIDGLRVDAVASMLYLDYGRKEGEWIPNEYGGRENLEAIAVPARRSTRRSTAIIPDVQAIAEESTAWPMVSRPTVRRRPRLRHEVEHGLDARHARLHARGPDPPQATTTTSSRSRCCTRSPRTSCCRCRTTKSCTARARCSARCRATCGSSSPTCGCCSATCGRTRARSCCSWAASSASGASGSTTARSNGGCSQQPEHARRAALGRATSTALYRGEPALHEVDFDAAGFEWIDCHDAEAERARASCARPRDGAAGAGGLQLHAGAAHELRGRRAARRLLARAAEQRRRASTAAAAWATSAASTAAPVPAHGRYALAAPDAAAARRRCS